MPNMYKNRSVDKVNGRWNVGEVRSKQDSTVLESCPFVHHQARTTAAAGKRNSRSQIHTLQVCRAIVDETSALID